MKKLFFLTALLCASVMGWAVAPDTWIGSTDAQYNNQFKWYEIDGVATPTEVVNIQHPGFSGQIGIYVTFPDAGFNAIYYNGVQKENATHFKIDGAGVCFYISSLTDKVTQIILKNGETTRFGLTIYNDKGAEPIASEYCGYYGPETLKDGAYVTLTWETLDNGDVQITMGNGEGATSCSFRNGGFEGGIDAFVVSTDNFETTTPASDYFTAEKVYSGNTFTLVKIADLPANAKIKHVGGGNVDAFSWTVNGTSAYGYPDFIYTYGGVCDASTFTDIKLSASSKLAKVGVGVTITAQAVDQNGLPMDDIDIDFEISPSDAGALVDGVFTFAKAVTATITASSGTISSEITLHGVPSDNLVATGLFCKGGYYDNNPAEKDSAAVDGNVNTAWVTYANRPASEEWLYVDLGKKYNISAFDVVWKQNYSTNYILQVRDDAPTQGDEADDAAWETLATITSATANSEVFTSVVGAGRYVRIHSLSRYQECIRLAEFRVYGTEWIDEDDTEKPVMVSATLESKTWNNAVIVVSATDNIGVTKYHVVNADPSIDVKLSPVDGKITINELTPSTAYSFTITALDAALNESDNSKSVIFTTDSHRFAPTETAAAPTHDGSLVKAIYSPTYSADCVIETAGWGSNAEYVEDTYGKKFITHSSGYFGMVNFNYDCSQMEKLHYDIWIADDASVRIVPILRYYDSTEEIYKNYPEYGETVNLTGQQWNSINLSLSEDNLASYTDWTSTYQVKIDQASNLTFWIGNAYFYKDTTTAISNTEAEVKAVKVIENGQLIIIKNGVRYTLMGAELR